MNCKLCASMYHPYNTLETKLSLVSTAPKIVASHVQSMLCAHTSKGSAVRVLTLPWYVTTGQCKKMCGNEKEGG